MKSADIRNKFLNYFAKQDHQIVASSSLVPGNDPTLLFTNAGMVQFKDVFLGQEKVAFARAVSSQRCIRAGGKHNDLENVGYTARHHTFFEMLGNFSFGDYFKQDAIKFAWEFLTKELSIPTEKLWVTVYQEDDEAAAIWEKDIGVPAERIIRCGEKSNFWSMGDTGPCGPCTEIFYDHGKDVWGGPPGSPEEDGDRYIEIWNLVFMQFNRSADGTMERLPKPSVDTGMGLERITAVMQDVHNNYDTDAFIPIIIAIETLLRPVKNIAELVVQGREHPLHTSMQVIADHIRSCAFLIADGVLPSNEGRGYVLRRIIRRAIRHGNKLGFTEAFFYKVVKVLAEQMGSAYPELVKAQTLIERTLKQEEEQFAKTLEQGLRIFEQAIADLQDKTIPGQVIFKLYDTFGFPMDLTGDIARERGLEMDIAGFEMAMQQQREQSQAASQFAVDYNKQLNIQVTTDFAGYETLATEAMVVAIIKNEQSVDSLAAGEAGFVILDRTPFYAESGGQVGDIGVLRNNTAEFTVTDTKKANAAHLHHGRVSKGVVRVGDKLNTQVDSERRQAVALNHTATHLLHAALQQILGEHVQQKGSLVEAERLRFDFVHSAPIAAEQLCQIETLVNDQIRANYPGITKIMSPAEAKAQGAMALFGEKYGDKVRVLSFGDFSKELCGGTHAARTGDIGLFKITVETGIAAGVRRIEAVTGSYAFGYVETADAQISYLAQQLKAPREAVQGKVLQLLNRTRELEKEIERLNAKLNSAASSDLATQATNYQGIQILFSKVLVADPKALRDMADHLKNKLAKAVIVLSAQFEDKISFIAVVTPDVVDRIKAGELINQVVMPLGGKGGGRADMAQAGANAPADVDLAFAHAKAWLLEKL
jgi:alanyl-tRNA synthetase